MWTEHWGGGQHTYSPPEPFGLVVSHSATWSPAKVFTNCPPIDTGMRVAMAVARWGLGAAVMGRAPLLSLTCAPCPCVASGLGWLSWLGSALLASPAALAGWAGWAAVL